MYLRLLLSCCLLASAPVAHAASMAPASVPGADAAASQNVVKGLINAIRYGKNEVGKKRLGTRTMAESLLGPTWAEMTPGERTHFTSGLTQLLVGTSFARGKEMFAYLDALLFKPPVREGERIRLGCTIVVHRELKKVEIPVEWVLGQEDGAWKVVDIVAQQESTCAGIREEEVLPLLKAGGVAKLLQALDERVAKLPAASKAAVTAAPKQAP